SARAGRAEHGWLGRSDAQALELQQLRGAGGRRAQGLQAVLQERHARRQSADDAVGGALAVAEADLYPVPVRRAGSRAWAWARARVLRKHGGRAASAFDGV